MAATRIPKILAASILSIVLVSCLFLLRTPNPIPVGADTAYYGNLVSGAKFGVAIGQSEAEAQETLSAGGNVLTGKFECSVSYMTTALLSCKTGEHFLAFYHKRFGRTGMIVLKTTNAKISQIGWSFHFFPHIDF